ncbi:unnamed protein product [Rangifer tarandus platyrhynchus]|uniref:Uncharacterized protein n=2 Tax=Rangifer tarandus platyrhynchus TaxID=3082113 RepID=A0ABN8YJ70_RANTA|nr:unnamed protein product [Rangifer tarandus platyrhynchus]CAI9700097.1 unnamed protein product [Rangifer tarandus platyrhynchus]
MRLPRARGADGRVSRLGRRQPQARVRPLTPRGWRAGGAGNLKIKSKQTGRVGEGERLELRSNDAGSHSLHFSFTLSPGSADNQADIHFPPGPSLPRWPFARGPPNPRSSEVNENSQLNLRDAGRDRKAPLDALHGGKRSSHSTPECSRLLPR